MDEEEKFQKQMQEYSDASLAFSLGKGSDPATDPRFDEYRKQSQARSNQAAAKLQDFNEQALISSTGGTDTFVAESTGVDTKMKVNDLTKGILNNTGGIDMSTSNVADGSQSVANTGASSNTGGARYSLIDPSKMASSMKTKPTITKPIQDLSITPTGKNMAETGKEASEARMKAAERSMSKNRFGLFGNYGKDVEIRKVRDASTGLISRQKFVDGERVQSGRERRASRKAFRRFK
tara:strand:+ start:75 stop:782 length:708 start_codon:yes stop_codon:yes gene_type:complete